jgi:hypothetical protein
MNEMSAIFISAVAVTGISFLMNELTRGVKPNRKDTHQRKQVSTKDGYSFQYSQARTR